jgi:hypothetical protein
MGSVALESALELRHGGNSGDSVQQAVVAGELLGRLADELITGCRVMEDEARHFAETPAVEPLDPSDFRSPSVLWSVTVSNLVHQVAFGARNRFFYKVRTVERIVEALIFELSETLDEVGDARLRRTGELSWNLLEPLHNDFNICLRESEVVLKSFLRALTPEVAEGVLTRLEAPAQRRSRPVRRRTKVSA